MRKLAENCMAYIVTDLVSGLISVRINTSIIKTNFYITKKITTHKMQYTINSREQNNLGEVCKDVHNNTAYTIS